MSMCGEFERGVRSMLVHLPCLDRIDRWIQPWIRNGWRGAGRARLVRAIAVLALAAGLLTACGGGGGSTGGGGGGDSGGGNGGGPATVRTLPTPTVPRSTENPTSTETTSSTPSSSDSEQGPSST